MWLFMTTKPFNFLHSLTNQSVLRTLAVPNSGSVLHYIGAVRPHRHILQADSDWVEGVWDYCEKRQTCFEPEAPAQCDWSHWTLRLLCRELGAPRRGLRHSGVLFHQVEYLWRPAHDLLLFHIPVPLHQCLCLPVHWDLVHRKFAKGYLGVYLLESWLILVNLKELSIVRPVIWF